MSYKLIIYPHYGENILSLDSSPSYEVASFTLQETRYVCRFIAYFVTEFEIVFHDLIFWRFLFLLPKTLNENACQIYVFYSNKKTIFLHERSGFLLYLPMLDNSFSNTNTYKIE